MSAIDKIVTLQNILNVVVKVLGVVDKVISYIIEQVPQKG